MFDEDLAKGRQAEERVKKFLEDKTGNPILKAPERCFKDYDLRMDMRHLPGERFEKLYEIKEDFGYDKTGNVAIEYGFNGHPSGILKSESEWYVYVCGDKATFIKRNTLLHEIMTDVLESKLENLGSEHDRPNMRGHLLRGGDNNQSLIYLMRYSRLLELGNTYNLPPPPLTM
jgi:hypothetical protein